MNNEPRVERFSLRDGSLMVQYPTKIHPDEVEDIVQFLALFERKLRRMVKLAATSVQKDQEAEGRA